MPRLPGYDALPTVKACAPCYFCTRRVVWTWHRIFGWEATNPDGGDHFGTCPPAAALHQRLRAVGKRKKARP